VFGRQDLRPQDRRPLGAFRFVRGPGALLRLLEVDLDVGSRRVPHVDETRIDRHSRAVEHDGVGRRRDVRADGVDDSVPQDNRPRRNRRARHRHETGTLDGV
jgi:hypothetical protein